MRFTAHQKDSRSARLRAVVKNLYIHPIKSLDRVSVETATILPGGGLRYDREFALFDGDGNFINGKRNSLVHHIRCDYDLTGFTVNLKASGVDDSGALHLITNKAELENWFSRYFAMPVTLRRNVTSGFPDDLDSAGPTIISIATLQKIFDWFPGISDAMESSRRFRSNIELDGVPAFWEDRLFRGRGELQPFLIGGVPFFGVNPCSRCVVPSRDSQSAKGTDGFLKKFAQLRRENLPEWTNAVRFDHFYRVAVNTRIAASEAGKTICSGDRLHLP